MTAFSRSHYRALTVLLSVLALVLPGALQAQEKAEGAETVILDTSGFWRYNFMLRKPILKPGSTLDEKQLQSFEKKFNLETPLLAPGWQAAGFDDSSWERVCGVPFPYRWGEVDNGFGMVSGYSGYDTSPNLALICMRGKFEITDPARVKELSLSVVYRGGVAAYLNGKEIAREHLPPGVVLTPETPAEEYPDEPFVAPGGSLLHYDGRVKLFKDKNPLLRQLSETKIPSSALCQGVNVLAVAVHRAPYPPLVAKKLEVPWDNCGILSVRLTSNTSEGVTPNVSRPKGFQVWNSDPLTYDTDFDFGDPNEPLRPIAIVGTPGGVFSGKVVVGSDQPLKGLKANMGALARIGGGGEIAPAAAQVRYASPSTSPLVSEKHYRCMNRGAVAGFDPLEETPPDEAPVRGDKAFRNDLLRPGQPKPVFGAVVPIWLTISVPADIAAGNYQGTLTVTAEGLKPVLVPVKLKVQAWKMPPPHEFRTFVELIQSPDTLAFYYKTPLWSDRHFQLIEKSLRLIGEVGNKTVHVPLICQTSLGNEQTLVRWVKQPDGEYTYDFSVLDRYLDLYARHCGSPEFVCLHVWGEFLEGGPHQFRDTAKEQGPSVTQFDPAAEKMMGKNAKKPSKLVIIKATWGNFAKNKTIDVTEKIKSSVGPYGLAVGADENSFGVIPEGPGRQLKVEYILDGQKKEETLDEGKGLGINIIRGMEDDLQLPPYSKAEESKALWKPLAEQLRQRMKARGWEDRLVLGLASDTLPTKQVVQLFQEIFPGVRWMVVAHGPGGDLCGIPFALREVVFAAHFITYPEAKTRLGWKINKFQFPAKGGEWISQTKAEFPRRILDCSPLLAYRLLPEQEIMGDQRGFGWFGADFWPVLKQAGGGFHRIGSVLDRYPLTIWGSLGIQNGTPAVLGAGKDGAVSTARLEMMREGLQECEARIFLEETLLDEGKKGKLGEALAGRCQAALNERTLDIERGINGGQTVEQEQQLGLRWYLASGWRERSNELYALAAEVAQKMGH